MVSIEIASDRADAPADPSWPPEALRRIAALEQRCRDLAAAAAEVDQRTRAQNLFLAHVSHELRTPMNAVLGMTDLALCEELSPQVRDYLQTAKDSAGVLLELLDEILDYARIESGRMQLESVPFELHALLAETIKALSVRAYAKGLEVVCEVAPDVPNRVLGDPLRLRQVLTNLLGNAVKFTRQGEIVLRAAVVGQDAGQALVRFAVTDTGIGVSPEDQQKIFAPFTQADASTTRRFGGSGLGLAISAGLVQRMGGRIWLESQLDRGSTFYCAIPLARQPGPDAALDIPPGLCERLRGLPVLVVDDHPASLRNVERLLSGWGARPEVAGDALAALARIHQAALRGETFALVLVDADMPGLDGFTLSEWLRGASQLAGPPILMLAPSDRRLPAARPKAAAGTRVLEKPVAPADLLAALSRVLEGDAAPPAPAEAARPTAPAAAAVCRKVLVVEDTPANRKLLESILTRRGHVVHAVENGREAIEAVRREAYDVVLMDVQMPELDGFQATAAIRALSDVSLRGVPIVAMTAHAMRGDRQRCLAAGMDAYLSKPVDRKSLLEMVESIPQRTATAPTGN